MDRGPRYRRLELEHSYYYYSFDPPFRLVPLRISSSFLSHGFFFFFLARMKGGCLDLPRPFLIIFVAQLYEIQTLSFHPVKQISPESKRSRHNNSDHRKPHLGAAVFSHIWTTGRRKPKEGAASEFERIGRMNLSLQEHFRGLNYFGQGQIIRHTCYA